MADWTDVTEAQTDPGAPGTSELFKALRDNAVAIAEGTANAPVVAAGWHPYDALAVSDGNDGEFYNSASPALTVETPTFTDGYEWAVEFERITPAAGASSPDLRIELFRQTTNTYGVAITLRAAVADGNLLSGMVYLPSVRSTLLAHWGHVVLGLGSAANNTGALNGVSAPLFYYTTTAQKISKARFSFSASVNIIGKMRLWRRKIP